MAEYLRSDEGKQFGFEDTGRFIGDRVLAVGGEQITARTIVIAAGTRPRIPDIDGLAKYTGAKTCVLQAPRLRG